MNKIKSFIVEFFNAWAEHRQQMIKKQIYRWY